MAGQVRRVQPRLPEQYDTGTPVALMAIAFGIGILIIPFALETTGQRLPE